MYSTFQSHEPEFDYLKSLEIEEKINKIKWLKRQNMAHFLLSTNGEYSIEVCKSQLAANTVGYCTCLFVEILEESRIYLLTIIQMLYFPEASEA